jgi:hypothetical protein
MGACCGLGWRRVQNQLEQVLFRNSQNEPHEKLDGRDGRVAPIRWSDLFAGDSGAPGPSELLRCYGRMDCRPSDNSPLTPITPVALDGGQPSMPFQNFGRVDYAPLSSNHSWAKLTNIPHANRIFGPSLQKVEQLLRG